MFTRLQQRGEAGEETRCSRGGAAERCGHTEQLSGRKAGLVSRCGDIRQQIEKLSTPPTSTTHPPAPTSTSTDGLKSACSCRAPSGGSAHTCPHLPTPDLRGLYDVGHPRTPHPEPLPTSVSLHHPPCTSTHHCISTQRPTMPAGMKPLEKFLKKQTTALTRAGGFVGGVADKASGGTGASRRRASLSRVVPFFRETSPESGQAREVFR